MKIYFITALLFCSLIQSCSSQESEVKNSENQVTDQSSVNEMKIEFLVNFYSEYIVAIADYDGYEPIEKLQQSSCTAELLRKIDNSGIDYDPFLNAQDAHEESLNSLEVIKCGDESDIFCISYLSGYLDEKVNIKLKVSSVNEELKISDIVGLK